MGDFSFRRDLKYVDWKKTIQLNAMRAAAAGLIVGSLMAVVVVSMGTTLGERAVGLAFPLIYAVILPIGLPMYFAIAVVCGKLGELGVPFVGWLPVFMAIMFAFGDPLIYLLHRSRPDLVPVDQPSVISLRLVIFVLDTMKVRPAHVVA